MTDGVPEWLIVREHAAVTRREVTHNSPLALSPLCESLVGGAKYFFGLKDALCKKTVYIPFEPPLLLPPFFFLIAGMRAL